MVYLILIAYIAITFLSSLRGAKEIGETPEGYFLANRNLTTLTLFFTILATNFSAFYFLGFAGEGYRKGYSFYVIRFALKARRFGRNCRFGLFHWILVLGWFGVFFVVSHDVMLTLSKRISG